MMGRRKSTSHGETATDTSDLLMSPGDYFVSSVDQALLESGFSTSPPARRYLVDLLSHFVISDNLFSEIRSDGRRRQETLAELYLRAQNSTEPVRFELLKKLGDTSLYISGFFSDSLQRKIVDVDYYVDMGGVAFSELRAMAREDESQQVFGEFARRFVDFVEVLSRISQQSKMHSEANILRLFELYSKTGSDSARQRLLEMGIIAVRPEDPQKKAV